MKYTILVVHSSDLRMRDEVKVARIPVKGDFIILGLHHREVTKVILNTDQAPGNWDAEVRVI